MKKTTIITGLSIILMIILVVVFFNFSTSIFFQPQQVPNKSIVGSTEANNASVVAENLSIPWDMAFLPSGDLLVTERTGDLLRIGENEKKYEIQGVKHTGEGGLLGIALHPNFSETKQVYLYLTTRTENGLINRVERYKLSNKKLQNKTTIITGIPGASYHDGGRIRFSPNNKLFITTGDATNSREAQNTNSLAGKILRVNPDGTIPEDNPYDNPVYSYGHRNPQGITWDDKNRLWSTEHGRSGIKSGFDELNLIKKGENYGWPVIQGSEKREGMETPVIHSGSDYTWAPASATYHNKSIFFGGLRGSSLYEAVNLTRNPSVKIHFRNEYGRIRTVKTGPNNQNLYLTTSNTDGRGNPRNNDDKIIKIPTETIK